MKRVLVTGPTVEPVSIAAAKEHSRVSYDFIEDDNYIDSLIKVAREYSEQYLKRKLITQTWKIYLDAWPAGDIVLPWGNLQSVTHVKYTDTDGTQTTWSSSTEYSVDTASEPGLIKLKYGKAYPTASLGPDNPIEIQFVCGYGDNSDSVPNAILQAILIQISDMYENREDVVIGMTVTASLKVVKKLLFPCILWGLVSG